METSACDLFPTLFFSRVHSLQIFHMPMSELIPLSQSVSICSWFHLVLERHMQWISSLMGIVTEEFSLSPYNDALTATLLLAEGSYNDRTVGVVSYLFTRLKCSFLWVSPDPGVFLLLNMQRLS